MSELTNSTAFGGTELIAQRLEQWVDPSLLADVQIWFSRFDAMKLDRTKKQIFYAHDLPSDPSSAHLANEGWKQYDKLVFVSNWQMSMYCYTFQIPFGECIVIENAISHPAVAKINTYPSNVVKLIYTSTPHRGLEILVPEFIKLARDDSSITLDVFSSFKLYGWEDQDRPYQYLFDMCIEHPQINYHGTQSNTVVRTALEHSHIFAYPSIWTETSCLCLIEAMSAGLICIHPNTGALPETAAKQTRMYQFSENKIEHTATFSSLLQEAILEVRCIGLNTNDLDDFAFINHGPNKFKTKWTKVLQGLNKRESETLIFTTGRHSSQ